mmetsp:Transcript_22753/g.38506  ORF Transcript_22753/g.38506 Transcript_22753/m.38506 type:complete len:857 (-) Transcript_22753:412-2982(-)
MKEYLDNEGVCFGVDCLRSYSEIRKLTQSSIRACEQLLLVVQRRVKAEEAHAASLADISQLPLNYSPGSLQDCMEQLQSDTNHKANQHQILADSLTEEVLRPIALLKDQMSKKENVLFGQYTKMNDELKKLQDSFTKKSTLFSKAYQNAISNVSSCRKYGISSEEYSKVTDLASNEPQANKALSATWTSLTSLTSNTNLLATKEKGKDLLNWVVASASGTPTGTPVPPALTPSTPVVDKKELCLLTMRSFEKLETCRVAARKAWLDYIVVSQRYAIKTQILLTKLQGMQESFILILQDHLRKIIVVESSFLANQQYDIQMLFKVMEDIDVKEDMRQFILKNASTPVDLYQSDDEEDAEDGENGSDIDRLRSTSIDADEHDVEIVIDQGGRPMSTDKKKTSVLENVKDNWCNIPWTSDIFPHSTKLSHVKELPLPPCKDTLTFSLLKNVVIETHLDQLDKSSTSKSTWHQHQYLSADSIREHCRLSLVSRHIEKHNSLVGEGQAGSLTRLEIAPSSSRKRRPQSKPSQSSVSQTSKPVVNDDPLSHPLTNDIDLLSTPVQNGDVLTNESKGGGSRDDFDGEESDDDCDDEDLMSYGTAEEAIEKMVILQTRMRQNWAALIKEISENTEEESSNTKCEDESKVSLENKNETNRNDGVNEEKGEEVNGVGDFDIEGNKNNELSLNNHSSEKLDQLDGSNMLGRSLRYAENETSENVDSLKCREIMNSFGLLDAVSIDVEDNWHAHDQNDGATTSRSQSEALVTSTNISPQAVRDMAVSTPVMRNKFSLTNSEGETLEMPFLGTSNSDFSDNSENALTKSSPCATPFNDQVIGSSTDDGINFSMNHFGNATPESLDFLSS